MLMCILIYFFPYVLLDTLFCFAGAKSLERRIVVYAYAVISLVEGGVTRWADRDGWRGGYTIEVDEEGCRQRPPPMFLFLWVLFEYSSFDHFHWSKSTYELRSIELDWTSVPFPSIGYAGSIESEQWIGTLKNKTQENRFEFEFEF